MRENTESVKVAVRCRPLSSVEKYDSRESIVIVDDKKEKIMIRNPMADLNDSFKSFEFEFVYGPESSQQLIYSDNAYSIVKSALDGYNCTIFSYGQTGTGKTFTVIMFVLIFLEIIPGSRK